MSLLSIEDQVLVAMRRITRAIDLHSRGLMQAIGLTAPQLACVSQPLQGFNQSLSAHWQGRFT